MNDTNVIPNDAICEPNIFHVPNAFSHQTARLFTALCIAAITSALCSLPCHAQSPKITSVSQISTQQIQTIVITGSGFGTQNSYTGNSAYIALFDLSNGQWQAGNVGSLEGAFENDWVTLIVKSWTDSQIVLGGFSGSWGQNSLGETPSGNWTLRVGDQEQIDIWNAQTAKGPASITTTVVAPSSTTLTIGPASLTPATLNTMYSVQLTASGGSAPYNFAVVSGSLPTGLIISSTGLIAGTPTQTATGAFTAQVKDAAGNTSQITYSLSVVPATTQPLEFYSMIPCRLVDTRVPSFQSGFGPPSLVAGTTRTFSILSNTNCGVPLTAAAYSLNITVVTKGYLGYLSIWPAGHPEPTVSTLNSYSTTSTAIANAAIVPAGTDGAINAYVTDDTDLIVDINGYFAPPLANGLEFYPVTPCRLVDTRVSSLQSGFGPPSLNAGTTRTFSIPSNMACGIPATAAAYSVNVTAVPQNTLGFLSIWPTGQSLPNVSTLNVYNFRDVVANAAIVPAGTNGGINAYVTDMTDLVIDINGYFAPATLNGLRFYSVTPCRVADTRVNSFPSGLGPPSMSAGTQRSFPVLTSSCGIPSGAGAYSLNFTAVPAAPSLGIFTTWPTGQPQPNVSTMNSYYGSVVSNAAIVPAGTNGAISIYVTDNTAVLFDVSAYFAP
jgi:hypothetical protein